MRGLMERMGIRMGDEAERRMRREREERERMLRSMMPVGAFDAWMSDEEMRLAAVRHPNDGFLRLVYDVIRRRHMTVLMGLNEWRPGQPADELAELAGRVKELVELSWTIKELVDRAGMEGSGQ